MEHLEIRRLLSGGVLQAATADVVAGAFNGKIDSFDLLYQAYATQGAAGGTAASSPLLQVVGDRIAIELLAADFNSGLQQQLEGLGMQITGRLGARVSGWIPLSSLGQLASIGGVRSVAPAYRPLTHAGSVTSQGDAVMRSDDVRRYLGYDGSGVTVGVISDSFDKGPGSYAQDIATGDLPSNVNVIADGPYGTDEGRAMLQLIHDVAPGANLAFASMFGGEGEFARNILALANAGADVIVDDVLYFTEPMFMDGVVAQAVDTVVARGIPYFSAAGNLARASYEASSFRPSGQYMYLGADAEYKEMLHDFDPGAGVDPYQQITVPVGTGIIISFQWAELFYSLVPSSGGARSDIDILLYPNGLSPEPIAGSSSFNVEGDPLEVFSFFNDGTYDNNHDGIPDTTFQLAIGQWETANQPFLKYVMFQYGDRSKGTVSIDEYASHSGTCYGHANAAGAFTVAAAYYEQTPEYREDPPLVEPFSSAGGTPIFFDRNGNPTGGILRNKPDITAPDGTSTSFFGSLPADDRTGQNSRPSFYGTSAAAPHVAGVAALLLQSKPGATPNQIYSAMRNTALDMGEPGRDPESGYGLIRAADALLALSGPLPVNVNAGIYANNGGVDTFRIVREDSRLLVYINSSLSFDASIYAIQSINITGSNDADNLIMDFSGGPIAPPIYYNGGLGHNILIIEGGSLGSTVHTLTSANSGSVNCDNTIVNYQAVSSINDMISASRVVLNGTSVVDHVNVLNGPAINGLTTTQLNSGNDTFVPVNIARKSNIVVKTGNASDIITVNNPLPAAGLRALTVDTEGGDEDLVHILSTASSVTTTVTSSGGPDAVTVGNSGSLQAIVGELYITNPSAFTRLDVDDSNDAVARTVTITPGAITGLAPATILFAVDGVSNLLIRGGRGGNTFNVTAAASDALPPIGLQAGPGNDTINANLAAGADLGLIQVAGQDGNDKLNFGGGAGNWDLGATGLLSRGEPRLVHSGIETLSLEQGSYAVSGGLPPNLVVGAAGILSPALDSGVLPTGAVKFDAQSKLIIDLRSTTASASHDQLRVTGAVQLNNASLLVNMGTTPLTPGDLFVIIRNDGSDPVAGSFAEGGTIAIGPDRFAVNYAYDADGDGNKNDVALVYTGSTNKAPTAANDQLGTREDTVLTVAPLTLLANDQDVDGDTLTITSVRMTDQAKGTAELKNGQVVFTPAQNFNGAATFTYTISDGHGGTSTGTVTVQVESVNDAPKLEPVPATFDTGEGQTVTFQAQAGDVDGDQLTFSLVNGPTGAGINPTTGLFVWTPSYTQAGTYNFTVQVTDKGNPALSASQAVTITVRDVSLTVPITALDGGQEGSVLEASYGGVVQAGMTFLWSVRKDGAAYSLPAGTATNQPTFRFTPANDGSYELKLSVATSTGNWAEGSRTVQVSNVAPTVNAGADATVGVGGTFTRTGTISDPGADTWTATVDYGDGTGVHPLSLNGKQFELSHFYQKTGTYTVKVTVNDGLASASDQMQLTVAEARLQVASLTRTESGFDLVFNRPVNVRKLNLYDGFDSSLDLPDLIVTGQKSGALNGTLFWDGPASATQATVLHWIKTGSALAPDNYTVMLASRSDGWVDAVGELLDGNGDGIAGGDYQGSFAVPASSTRIVSLPDVARGPMQSMTLPIRVDVAAGVSSLDMELVFNPAMLNVSEIALAKGMPSDWNVMTNVVEPGRWVITAFGATGLSGAAKDLLTLKASVPTGLTYGTVSVLKLEDVELNEVSARGDTAVHAVAYVGDATGNGKYSGVDASSIAAVSIGLINGFDAYPLVDPAIIGDATANGSLSAMDASFVAQKSVGLARPEIPDLPNAAPAAPLAAKAVAGTSVVNRAAFSSQTIRSQQHETPPAGKILHRWAAKAPVQAGTLFGSKRLSWIFQDDF